MALREMVAPRRLSDALSDRPVGATYLGEERCSFVVWAPSHRQVEVHVVLPSDRKGRLEPTDDGYHVGILDDVEPGARYFYVLDGEVERPDPASRCQPDGVHGPSEVIDPNAFEWQDGEWMGIPLDDLIIYEIHVGTFTTEGTFDAAVERLDDLCDLGITAVELMPVAQFPGGRNWGYDGTYPFAAQNSYGGPDGLRRFVDACHRRGLGVILDVVYNHLGPEGNYLGAFAPYFTDFYRTPWGQALNFDGPDSDQVRRYFIENARYWLLDCHLDGLRLDAVHAIRDFSARPFLQELAQHVSAWERVARRPLHLIAESDLNDARLILPEAAGGYGLDAQWSDDFHHAVHALLTGERDGYYADFGGLQPLARALREAYVYGGDYSPYRRRRHGNSAAANPARQFVVCTQNHDQVGNRILGDRLSQLVGFEALKQAAALLLLSPYVPLLFMGEEYGETAPFLYFTSHSDPDLIRAVQRGRADEFAAFTWKGTVPDPQDEATFRRSRLQSAIRKQPSNSALRSFYRRLIELRRTLPALRHLSKERIEAVAFEGSDTLVVRRWQDNDQIFSIFRFERPIDTGHGEVARDGRRDVSLPVPAGLWRKLLDGADTQWHGTGEVLPATIDTRRTPSVVVPTGACALYQLDQGRAS